MKTIKFKQGIYLAACCLFMAAFTSCNTEPDYKIVRQEAMDLHDKLMADGEIAVQNKMALDTFALKGLVMKKKEDPKLDTAGERQQINQLLAKLNTADEHMMDWMQQFKVDVEGMSNSAAVAYFKAEKVKLLKLDSLYKIALGDSEAYLKKFGVN